MITAEDQILIGKIVEAKLKHYNLISDEYTPFGAKLKDIVEPKGVVNEAEQERWKPRKNEIYWCVDLSAENGIMDYVNENDEIDKLFYTTHNYFKTEQEAQEKANQIKELLSKK